MFKNELGKEVKVVMTAKQMSGMKGAKNLPVEYQGINLKMTSVDHNFEVSLTKKELDKIRFESNKFLKEIGRKSEPEEL